LDSKTHNAKFSAWELVVFSGNNTQNIAWSNETVLPHARLQNITANSNNDKLVFLKLPIEEKVTETITLAGDLYIIQFRNASNEELEFARIADQLP
jgi:predicted RNase H-like nuclease